jgi:DNA-binding SARP family transcriptional activator
MFGSFQLTYRGQTVDLKSGASTKAMQILELLLYHAPTAVSSNTLIDELFRYDDVISPKNNLKVSISQLRKRLSASDLPGSDFISFKSGDYFWSCPVPMKLDVKEFEALIARGDIAHTPDRQLEYYRQAFELYQDHFLPELVGIDWATALNTYYYNLCAVVVRKSVSILMSDKEYDAAYAMLERMSKLRHSEEWQVLKMDCMMKMGRWEQAKQIYQDTVTTLSQEYDVEPSVSLISQYRRLSEQTQSPVTTLESVLTEMREADDRDGAYFCAYPGFVDACRVAARNMNRDGLSCFLMMVSMVDRRGRPVQNPERLGDASQKLSQAIKRALRQGDCYTQYNASQFLLFLYGANQENCHQVAERIKQLFSEDSVRGVQLSYQATSCAWNMDADLALETVSTAGQLG